MFIRVVLELVVPFILGAIFGYAVGWWDGFFGVNRFPLFP